MIRGLACSDRSELGEIGLLLDLLKSSVTAPFVGKTQHTTVFKKTSKLFHSYSRMLMSPISAVSRHDCGSACKNDPVSAPICYVSHWFLLFRWVNSRRRFTQSVLIVTILVVSFAVRAAPRIKLEPIDDVVQIVWSNNTQIVVSDVVSQSYTGTRVFIAPAASDYAKNQRISFYVSVYNYSPENV